MMEFISNNLGRFIFYLIIIAILVGLYLRRNALYKIKVPGERRKLVENNEFVSNNYEEIINIVKENATFRKKYYLIAAAISSSFTIILFLIFIFSHKKLVNYLQTAFLGLILFALIMLYLSHRYKNVFKEKVITRVLEAYNPLLEYNPYSGIEEVEYKTCRFIDLYDDFYSEDLILDTVNDILVSDIKLINKIEDNEGGSRNETTFEGSIAKTIIKDCGCNVYLGRVRGDRLFNKNNLVSITLENDEFNKLFHVATDNEILAYKILSPDIQEQLVNLKKETFGDIEIRFLHDKLYVRFYSGDGFKPFLISKKIEINNIATSLAVLESVLNTMKYIKDILAKKNF